MQEIFRQRQILKSAIRRFFDDRQYVEVETPILVPQPGVEVHIDYFATTWHDLAGRARPFFLRSSPELAMKRLLCHDLSKIFQMGPCFRSGGEFTAWHQPEFSLLEWYQTGADLATMIAETESLCRYTEAAMIKTLGSQPILPSKLTKITVAEAFAEFAKIDLQDLDPDLPIKAIDRGWHSVNKTDDFETAYFKLLLDAVEPALKKLKFACLYNFPPSQAVLAVIEGDVAQRFEFYVDGVELCNAFYECTDARENRKRLNETNHQRLALGKTELHADLEYFADLERGMPACSGNALGLDRWLSLLLGTSNLDAVLPLARSFYR